MHIAQPSPKYSSLNKAQAIAELEQVIAKGMPSQFPICPNCTNNGKSSNGSACNSNCPDRSTALSIDPENWPIENAIINLVFAMTQTGVFETFWSCEGHLNPENKLWKLPRISFYSSSPTYLRLLIMHLNELNTKHQLNEFWHIVLTDYGDVSEHGYSLQPELSTYEQCNMKQLQEDLKTISLSLSDKLRKNSQRLLQIIRYQ